MLDTLGYTSLDGLLADAVPASIRDKSELALPAAGTEAEVAKELVALAAQNTVLTSMIGLGYYGTVTPGVIRRNVLESPAWYTAYTPYQPEISQGRLEALLNFQTMVEDLTALPIAGASLLDESTAAAEAMALSHRAARAGSVFLVDADVLPQTLDVLRDPRPSDRRRSTGRRSRRRASDRRCLRRADPVPGRVRAGARPRADRRVGPRGRCAGDGRGRPARAHLAAPAGGGRG